MELARSSLTRILEAHRFEDVYQLSDYLWLLVYESLEAMCQIHNEDARSGEYPGGLIPIGEHRFRRIDFETLLQLYFWDLDFLSSRRRAASCRAWGICRRKRRKSRR